MIKLDWYRGRDKQPLFYSYVIRNHRGKVNYFHVAIGRLGLIAKFPRKFGF
jgi:hypothetical protein